MFGGGVACLAVYVVYGEAVADGAAQRHRVHGEAQRTYRPRQRGRGRVGRQGRRIYLRCWPRCPLRGGGRRGLLGLPFLVLCGGGLHPNALPPPSFYFCVLLLVLHFVYLCHGLSPCWNVKRATEFHPFSTRTAEKLLPPPNDTNKQRDGADRGCRGGCCWKLPTAARLINASPGGGQQRHLRGRARLDVDQRGRAAGGGGCWVHEPQHVPAPCHGRQWRGAAPAGLSLAQQQRQQQATTERSGARAAGALRGAAVPGEARAGEAQHRGHPLHHHQGHPHPPRGLLLQGPPGTTTAPPPSLSFPAARTPRTTHRTQHTCFREGGGNKRKGTPVALTHGMRARARCRTGTFRARWTTRAPTSSTGARPLPPPPSPFEPHLTR
jgi:hypothetical protein